MSEELPTLWAEASLGDVVDVLDSEREPVNAATRAGMLEQEEDAERFPYFGATGQVGWINSFRSEGERTLLGEDGAPFLDQFKPKAYVVSGRFWVNNHAHVLRGKAGVLDSRFLCHQLNTVDYQPFVTGTTRLKLTSGAMRQIPLRVAPIAEQLRVVIRIEELLSDLESGVAELQAAQKKLGQYRQSLLKEAVEGTLTAEWRVQNLPQEAGAELLARILRERRARWEARRLEKFKAQGKEPPKEWQRQYPAAVEPSLAGLPVLPSTWTWASLDMLGAIASSVAKGMPLHTT